MEKKLRWRIAQFLEVLWWRRYLSGKSPEAYLQWKRSYWQQLLAEIKEYVAIKSGQKVLDAGCGPAGIFIALEGCEVTAMDPLLGKYAELPHFRQADYPHTHFKELAIEALVDTEQFDVIFCLNAINHVSDISLAYDRLLSALRPGGTLVVSIDAHNHGVLKKIFRLLPGDALHPHQYDLSEYSAFLSERGLILTHTLLKDRGFIFNYYVQVATKV